jgi:hypothetical protein
VYLAVVGDKRWESAPSLGAASAALKSVEDVLGSVIDVGARQEPVSHIETHANLEKVARPIANASEFARPHRSSVNVATPLEAAARGIRREPKGYSEWSFGHGSDKGTRSSSRRLTR